MEREYDMTTVKGEDGGHPWMAVTKSRIYSLLHSRCNNSCFKLLEDRKGINGK
jgi:hypothetical protein